MSLSSIGGPLVGDILNGYIGGHSVLVILKSLSKPEYVIKINALNLHPSSMNIVNEFGWDDVSSDASRVSYAITEDSNPNQLRKQKFVGLNSRTEITIEGSVAPYMYFWLDEKIGSLIKKTANPFSTIKLMRVLGLKGVKFKAYGDHEDIDGIIDYGTWILKGLNWDASNFVYSNSAQKIEFTATFGVDLGVGGTSGTSAQFEGSSEVDVSSIKSTFDNKLWS